MTMKRNVMAGCEPDDKIAKALAQALHTIAGKNNSVQSHGVVGATWRPNRGGWVVHNAAWALRGVLPGVVLRAALSILHGDASNEIRMEDRRGSIIEAAKKSYWAAREEASST